MALFVHLWHNITDVLSALKIGVTSHFQRLPPLFSSQSLSGSLEISIGSTSGLQHEISIMLKNAPNPGFYSRLSLVSKATGGWRPVIDLSRLNQFLVIPTFKMESTSTITRAVRPRDWTVSIDLKDAYFHVSIHPSYRRYLRFVWKKQNLQFRALPFGLATAPRIFFRIVSAIGAFWHRRGFLYDKALI